MKSFCFAAKNENSPFYLHIPSVIFQVTRLPYSLIRHREKKIKNHQISHFPYVQTDIVVASLKAFISLLTANWTSFNVTTTSQEPKRLKKRRKFENQKKKVVSFSVPQDGFLSRSSSRDSRQKKLIWLSRAKSCLFFFFPRLALALSLSRSLAPSMATFPSNLGGAPACASLSESLFSKKDALCESINRFPNRKLWVSNQILAPTAAAPAKSAL